MVEKNSQVVTLESTLWDAASVLRGKMTAEEYKNYLLGLIFYRFLSEQALEAAGVFAMVDSDMTDAYVRMFHSLNIVQGRAEQDQFRDQLRENLGFVIKPENLFGAFAKSAQEREFKCEDLLEAFKDLEESTKELPSYPAFVGLFSDLDFNNPKLGLTKAQRDRTIGQLIIALNKVNIEGHHGEFLADAYEYLIAQLASESGKKAEEFYTPRSVAEIMAHIINYDCEPVITLYDPVLGSGSLLLTVGEHTKEPEIVHYYGQDVNPAMYNVARMNLMMHGVGYDRMDVRNGDSLDKDWPIAPVSKFDAVVMNLPIQAQWDNDFSRLRDERYQEYGVLAPADRPEYAFLQHGLHHLSETGTMAIVLPHSALFAGDNEGEIRQKLLENNQIDAVIGLPENIFHGTEQPAVLMILKKNKTTDDIIFIDASQEFEYGLTENKLTDDEIEKIATTYKNRVTHPGYAELVTFADVKENGYILSIPRYVSQIQPEPEIDLLQIKERLEQIDSELVQAQQDFKALEAELIDTTKSGDLHD